MLSEFDISYNDKLCSKVENQETQIWNSDWLKDSLKFIIRDSSIVSEGKISSMSARISKPEVSVFDSYYPG
jgi:hypothetical protein